MLGAQLLGLGLELGQAGLPGGKLGLCPLLDRRLLARQAVTLGAGFVTLNLQPDRQAADGVLLLSIDDLLPILVRGVNGDRKAHEDEAHQEDEHDEDFADEVHRCSL